MKNYIVVLMSILAFSCLEKSDPEVEIEGLKDSFGQYFPIGVAIPSSSLNNADTTLIKKEFNSVTAENLMKMGPMQPIEGVFKWEEADKLVEFAQKNNIRVRGHALCWHEQTPDWFFVDDQGNDVSKEVLLKRLQTHIETIVKRYKGKIYAWDVVNEAIDDDSTKFLRNSKFYQICGEDFIVKAFEYAHEADPAAQLFYNDYNADLPEKRDRIYRLGKMLLDRGVPIHGIGMQGHWSIYSPSQSELETAIDQYSSLGLTVQVTELDVSIYPWEKERRERKPDEEDELTLELEQQQIEQYSMFFRVFKAKKDVVSGITLWGVSDGHSWLNHYPVNGRDNYPLLFNRDLKRKPVYDAITSLK
ncbi:MAG: endo-1,4-beta-xylanase [Reichenbachiella sp.]